MSRASSRPHPASIADGGTRRRRFLAWLGRVGLMVAAGLATWAAFPPVGAWWAAPLGLGLAGAVLGQRRLWGSAGLGLVYGFGFFAPLLHFTAVSMGNNLGWAALTVVESLYLAAWAAAWSLVRRLPALTSARHPALAAAGRITCFALLFAGVEELRSSWPWGGFPFGRLAFAMADAPALPVAAYGGSLGLSLLVALSAGAVAEALRAGRRLTLLTTIVCTACACGLMVAPLGLSFPALPESATVTLAGVQGSLDSPERTSAGADAAFGKALQVTGAHAAATKELAHRLQASSSSTGIDAVVWPENAADLDPRTYPEAAALVEQAAQAAGAPIIVGAVAYEDRGTTRVRYNDAVIWQPGQGAGEYYRKHQPVPFGEYIPLREQLRRLTSQVDRISTDMLPGTGPHTLSLTGAASGTPMRMAMGICFEVAYDSALRAGITEGGQVIVIPTNNASFGTSSEAAQQLAQGRIQAVVHGRSVLQVSTVGITAVINPRGAVTQELEPYTPGAMLAQVPLRSGLTLADRLGPWPGRLVLGACAALSLAGGLSVMRQARRSRRHRRGSRSR